MAHVGQCSFEEIVTHEKSLHLGQLARASWNAATQSAVAEVHAPELLQPSERRWDTPNKGALVRERVREDKVL